MRPALWLVIPNAVKDLELKLLDPFATLRVTIAVGADLCVCPKRRKKKRVDTQVHTLRMCRIFRQMCYKYWQITSILHLYLMLKRIGVLSQKKQLQLNHKQRKRLSEDSLFLCLYNFLTSLNLVLYVSFQYDLRKSGLSFLHPFLLQLFLNLGFLQSRSRF